MPSPRLLLLLLPTILILLSIHRLTLILSPHRPRRRHDPAHHHHLLVVLGSGGHTAEIIAMLERATTPGGGGGSDSAAAAGGQGHEKQLLEWAKFTRRTWVVGEGDAISALRAREFEEKQLQQLQQQQQQQQQQQRRRAQDSNAAAGGGDTKAEGTIETSSSSWDVVAVPRARAIHQSALTAPASCLRCLLACWAVLTRPTKKPGETHHHHGPPLGGRGAIDFPDLILCNGPATATILVFTSLLLRFFDVGGCHSLGRMRTIYVESWARVRRLSLSGKLLCHVVDRCLVQWPQLQASAGNRGVGRAEFIGTLV